MDLVQGAVNKAADAAINIRDEIKQFEGKETMFSDLFSNLTLLSIVISSVAGIKKPFSKLQFKEEYDYIIVGGGTAGSVMASRLSENSCITVLLIEAGGEPSALTEIPAFARVLYGSNIDWLYKTTPQQYAAYGQKENRVNWNNGKVLGGTSVLNAMLYVRGNKQNYDDWEKEGATGWSYKDVLPFFLKLEDNINTEELDPGYHRKGGPQTVEKTNYVPEIKNPILEATKDMGFELRDINGERQTGMYDVQATVRNQQRCSTAKSYLEPARDRENLDILTFAFAKKILIRNRNGENEAYGIEFDFLGKSQTVYARREVIISNGSIRTPQILMLSGIGPREQLEKLKIPVIADLPVGKNMQDHCAANLVYTVSETILPIVPKTVLPTSLLDYALRRKGPLTVPNQVNVLAFLNGLNTTKDSVDFPRQEVYFCEYDVIDAKLNLNLKDEVFLQVYAPYLLRPIYICYSSLLQPYGRGEITLNSTDPYDRPLIDPKYYEDERDLKDVVEGMKICEAVAKHPAMKKVQAKLLTTQNTGFPNCTNVQGDKDAYLGCIARQVVNTFWHIVGTARMGQRDDPRSVVDPELRVIGVNNLRVINAAVMPIIPSGNTNIPTIMVAEKAYYMMKRHISCDRTESSKRRTGHHGHNRKLPSFFWG